MRQAARHGAEHVHLCAQVQRPARADGACHGDQRTGDPFRHLPGNQDDGQHAQRDGEGVRVDLLDLLQVVPDLRERAVAAPFQAEHARDLAERDLHADARQEPDQHRAGQEIREEGETDGTREDQEARGHEREHPGQRDVLVGADGLQAHEPRGEDEVPDLVGFPEPGRSEAPGEAL